jgi:hypothetical protein
MFFKTNRALAPEVRFCSRDDFFSSLLRLNSATHSRCPWRLGSTAHGRAHVENNRTTPLEFTVYSHSCFKPSAIIAGPSKSNCCAR